MKLNFLAIVFVTLLGLPQAFATPLNEVVLEGNQVTVNSNHATVIRTATSPKKIELFMEVPMTNSYCAQYSQRMVYGTDASCGYHTEYQDRYVTVCLLYRGNQCVQTGSRLETYPVSVMNACTHPETYCSETAYRTAPESKSVKLVFKNVAPLQGNQFERFDIHAVQNGVDSGSAHFSMSAVTSGLNYTYEEKTFLGHRLVIDSNSR